MAEHAPSFTVVNDTTITFTVPPRPTPGGAGNAFPYVVGKGGTVHNFPSVVFTYL